MRPSDIIPSDFVPFYRLYPHPEQELWYHNVTIAQFTILNGLALGDDQQRQWLLQCVQPEFLGGKKLLTGFLFHVMSELYRQRQAIDLAYVTAQIPQFGQLVYGEPSSKEFVAGNLYNWYLTLSLEPTRWEVTQSVALIHIVAERRNLLDRSICPDAPRLEDIPPWHRGMDPTLPAFDLDVELFERERCLVADLVILAALAKGDAAQRTFIFTHMRTEYLPFGFEVFLYEAMQRQHEEQGAINLTQIHRQIRDYISWETKRRLKVEEVELYRRRWEAVLTLTPTPRQVEQAVALRLKIGLRRVGYNRPQPRVRRKGHSAVGE